MEDLRIKPAFSLEDAASISQEHFGFRGVASELPSERDQNFRITGDSESVVIKIAHPETSELVLELENAAMQLCIGIDSLECPRLIRSKAASPIVPLKDANRRICRARCISFLPGVPLANFSPHSPSLLNELGRQLGELDLALGELNQSSAAKREMKWDLGNAAKIVEMTQLKNPAQEALLKTCLKRYQQIEPRLDGLRQSVIHNDANDYNVLINHDPLTNSATIGIIDFGDMLFSKTIFDLAICAAYVVLGKENPLDSAAAVVAGYHQASPLVEEELAVLFPLICMRLCQSVCIAVEQQAMAPENEYLGITEKPAWAALEKLALIEPADVHMRLSDVCQRAGLRPPATGLQSSANKQQVAELRERFLPPSLSLSYDRPLQMIRGQGQYLYDESDITFLDCVNNVCHVGHCHPHVVKAAAEQMSRLNTNSRYLHETRVRYAERLVSKFPDSLNVCFLVNSGSEANDLALRLARNFTQQNDVVVIDHAYHGHLTSLIEISPYKYNRAGGKGKPEHVHSLPTPDGYRGQFKYDEQDYGTKYAELAVGVIGAIAGEGRGVGAFFAESILSCGGQIPLPQNYLAEVYKQVRLVGGVCIADEVQVGFGRVGTHFSGFEQHSVVPEIVTLGKPMGNGHPLAAVVTTQEIADAFNNGMEYFNTFGGNPVSCAVGMAVLDVIEQEGLQDHARALGSWLKDNLNQLKDEFPCIGDVRGSGLFLGIEFVSDRGTLKPAPKLAHAVVQRMKNRRILLSTDGPLENVIKIKPPMVFSEGDAERLVMTLRETLNEL